MTEKLKEYLEIELAGFAKAKRNQLHLELINDLAEENLEFENILILLYEAECKNVVIRQPFFEKIVYPILSVEVLQDNIQAIKSLIKLEQKLIQLQNKTKDFELSKLQLFLRGLQIKPDDNELLNMYEIYLRDYLSYTIHEIPSGVLFDINGASESECDELIELLKEYKKICKKLHLNRILLINECDFHFQNYKAYLLSRSEFADYSDFLKSKSRSSVL